MKYAVDLEMKWNGTVLLTNAQCHDGTHISRPAHLVYWKFVPFRAKRALSACFSKKAESARYIILFSCSQSCPYRLQLAGRALTRAKGGPPPRARTPPAKRYEQLWEREWSHLGFRVIEGLYFLQNRFITICEWWSVTKDQGDVTTAQPLFQTSMIAKIWLTKEKQQRNKFTSNILICRKLHDQKTRQILRKKDVL